MQLNSGRTVILVKAKPIPSDKYEETVCCAGMNENGTWARLYPVPFRRLDEKQQFSRWDWVEYQWKKPLLKDDDRPESRHLQEESIVVGQKMKTNERIDFINRYIQSSTDEAYSKGMSLALLRPRVLKFKHQKKSDSEIRQEAHAYEVAVKQQSLFSAGESLEAIQPCPYRFSYEWCSDDGAKHVSTCGDWETDATFYKWRRRYGEAEALQAMARRYGEEMPLNGLVFAMGTHSVRQKQWLLVGLLQVPSPKQQQLFI